MAKPALKIVNKVEEAPPVHGDGDDGGVYYSEDKEAALQMAIAVYQAKCAMYAASEELCDDDPLEMAERFVSFILVSEP